MLQMEAKVYDFDPVWDVPDGHDTRGDYVLRSIRSRSSDGTVVLNNGTRSADYEVVSTGAESEDENEQR